jgi:uncharacterized protein
VKGAPALVLAAFVAAIPASAQARSLPQATTWSGAFTLPGGTQSSSIALVESGGSAVVSLAPGRAASDVVRLNARKNGVVSFRLPGRPSDLLFTGRRHGTLISGKVSQGAARGSFHLARRARGGEPFLGTYTSPAGAALELIDLGRLGLPLWLVDLKTGAFHALYRSGSAFQVGAFRSRRPSAGSITIAGARLAWQPAVGASVNAVRLPVRQEEVRFPSTGASLSGTLTLPASPGPHPAVAWVHGSGPSLRDEGQFFVGILAREGIAVLTYDKRGNGSSTGVYPGELPTDTALRSYAVDAAAAARFLARQPQIDPKRIGLIGGSQGGWVIPLATLREPAISFAIIESGPTVSVGETDDFTSLTAEGNAPLSEPLAAIDAQVKRDGPSGFDPRPSLRRIRIPMLWLYGGLDMNQPSALDVEVLQQLKAETGADYSWRVFPNGNHGIFEVKTGLNSELDQSRGMPADFFTTVQDWLRGQGLSPGTGFHGTGRLRLERDGNPSSGGLSHVSERRRRVGRAGVLPLPSPRRLCR